MLVFLKEMAQPLVQQGWYDWGRGPGMMSWGYGTSWFWHIAMMLFWIAVIVGIIFLIRWLVVAARTGGGTSGEGGEQPLEILKRRYARGEIDKEKFEERKRGLLS